ncbi:hypothetical protein KvSKV_07320 [Ketogulonicigenium vulgare]|nr:hypothetical protein KvSKV_07320 [Ketogulonicigenium vulgare]
MLRYRFKAHSRVDGTLLDEGVIDDALGDGVNETAFILRQALVLSHPMAKKLLLDDIAIELSCNC